MQELGEACVIGSCWLTRDCWIQIELRIILLRDLVPVNADLNVVIRGGFVEDTSCGERHRLAELPLHVCGDVFSFKLETQTLGGCACGEGYVPLLNKGQLFGDSINVVFDGSCHEPIERRSALRLVAGETRVFQRSNLFQPFRTLSKNAPTPLQDPLLPLFIKNNLYRYLGWNGWNIQWC